MDSDENRWTNHCGCLTKCVTGSLGCKWRIQQHKSSTTKFDWVWLSVLFLLMAVMSFMLYYLVIAGNSSDEFSWYLYDKVRVWVPVYIIFLILTFVAYVYTGIIFVLFLCHVGFDFRFYIHWSHKVVMVLIIVGSVGLVVFLHMLWSQGWTLLSISIMTSAPFIQVTDVAFMTLMSWFILGRWVRIKTIVWRIIWMVVFAVVMLFLYLIPLAIISPCICNTQDLPNKPIMFAHKGASAIRPENTMLSFDLATTYKSVKGIETDVSISYDGIPFLLHDKTLERTTNVKDVYPDRAGDCSCMFNMSEIEQLDAGSWFLGRDPFLTVSGLSQEVKDEIKKAKVPTLDELLTLIKRSKKKLLFDLKNSDDGGLPEDHPYYNSYADVVIQTILKHDIAQENIYWLYEDMLNTTVDNNFTDIYGKDKAVDLLQYNNIPINVPFQRATLNDVREYQDQNISTNVWTVNSAWLYSLYWCMGVSSITTDYVHTFSMIKQPFWQLSPLKYYIMWIVTDVLSLILIIVIFIIQRKRAKSESYGPETIYMKNAIY